MSRPRTEPFDWFGAFSGIGCSTLLHVGAAGALFTTSVMGGICSPSREPLIRDTIEVSMVSLPKSATNVPDRATRIRNAPVAPQAPSPEPVAAPEPAKAAPTPPPVKESDLAINKPEQPKPAEPAPDNGAKAKAQAERKAKRKADEERQRMLDEIARAEALGSLVDGAEGDKNQAATDPNSDSNEALNLLGAGAMGDPEFGRYIAQVQRKLMEKFHPTEKGLKAKVFLTVDPATGVILSEEIKQSSGNSQFDAACLQAVKAAHKIPLPTDKYKPLLKTGFEVNFKS